MFKQICTLLLLTVFASAFYSPNKPSQTHSTLSDVHAGLPKIINPSGKTPFPYNFSVDNGLPDKSGNLWFATSEGVYSYDGKLFNNHLVMHGLRVDHISTMLRDTKGNIWFGAHGGVVRYQPSGRPGANESSFTAVKIQRANNDRFVYAVKDTAGDTSKIVTQIMEDKNGEIWFCSGYDIYRSNGQAATAITTSIADFLKSEKVQHHCKYPDDFGICGIYEDKQGNILISTRACSCGPDVIYKLDGRKVNDSCILNRCMHDLHNKDDRAAHDKKIASSFTKITDEASNTNICFTTVLEDKGGKVWVGTDSGVYTYDGNRFEHFTTGDLLSKSVVSAIYQDKEGSIWFGTGESTNFKGNGAFRYTPSASSKPVAPFITQFTTKEGLCNNGSFKSNIISSIAEDNTGKLWVSGDGGVSYYNGKGFTSLTTAEGFTNQPVKCMVKDKAGNLWFGTWLLGLYRYDGISLTCFTENKPKL